MYNSKLPFHVLALFEDLKQEPKTIELIDLVEQPSKLNDALMQFGLEDYIYFLPHTLGRSIVVTNVQPFGHIASVFKNDFKQRFELTKQDINILVTKALNYVDPELLLVDDADDVFLYNLSDFARKLNGYANNYLDLIDAEFIKT